MNSAVLNASQVQFPEKWEKAKDVYTGNDLIDAFLKGVEVGRDEERSAIREKVRANIIRATQVAEELLQKAQTNNIGLRTIHLKANTIASFTVLYVADYNEYLSDGFREVYVLANQLETEVNNPDFTIHFSFTHNAPIPFEESLAADGFFLKYEKEHRSIESCTS